MLNSLIFVLPGVLFASPEHDSLENIVRVPTVDVNVEILKGLEAKTAKANLPTATSAKSGKAKVEAALLRTSEAKVAMLISKARKLMEFLLRAPKVGSLKTLTLPMTLGVNVVRTETQGACLRR